MWLWPIKCFARPSFLCGHLLLPSPKSETPQIRFGFWNLESPQRQPPSRKTASHARCWPSIKPRLPRRHRSASPPFLLVLVLEHHRVVSGLDKKRKSSDRRSRGGVRVRPPPQRLERSREGDEMATRTASATRARGRRCPRTRTWCRRSLVR